MRAQVKYDAPAQHCYVKYSQCRGKCPAFEDWGKNCCHQRGENERIESVGDEDEALVETLRYRSETNKIIHHPLPQN